MSLDYALLGLLAEHPRSGYDMKTRVFDGPLSPFWSADQAQIYRTLDRLEKERLCRSRRRRQAGRPDRRIYEITHAGVEALGEWLLEPEPLPPTRDPLMLRMHFAATLSDASLIALLEARRTQHQGRLDSARDHARGLANAPTQSLRSLTLREAALEGTAARERAIIDWLDDCIDAIRDGALPGSESTEIGQRHLFGT